MVTARAVSVVVLTYNEQLNLERCLESVAGWADALFIVDSGSTDSTIDIARRYGAQVFTHPFVNHVRQWQWAFAELPLDGQWVLALDADQSVTPELRAEITRNVAAWTAPGSPVGAYVNRRQVFRGRWIRHGGYYPKYLLKLFRSDAVALDEADLVDHHFLVNGPTAILQGDLVEDNRNEAEISVWIAKHNKYAALQARDEESRWASAAAPRGSLGGTPDDRTLWMKRLWNRMPLFLRPFGYFFYRYILRLGFLDGKQGFIFHFMQAFWYRLLVDINRDEIRSRTDARQGSRFGTVTHAAASSTAVDPDAARAEKTV
jgi:glycosyltransferase involved in cell wall biosynthesis